MPAWLALRSSPRPTRTSCLSRQLANQVGSAQPDWGPSDRGRQGTFVTLVSSAAGAAGLFSLGITCAIELVRLPTLELHAGSVAMWRSCTWITPYT